MDSAASFVAIPLGALLVALGLVDVFFTILHADRQGPATRWVNAALWRLSLALVRRSRLARRRVLSLAGPMMMASTILLWVGLLVVGFALIAWPHMETRYRLDPALGRPTLLDALYYSGVTFTTLGFGDVTPVGPAAKVLAVVESGSGFAVMTAAITYLLTLFQGLETRNAMALRVLSETGGTGRGVRVLVRSLRDEGDEALRDRLEAWTGQILLLQERVHRFPILMLYYRMRTRTQDPEPMLAAVAEAAIGAGLLAQTPGHRALRPAAEHLEMALVQLMRAIARHHEASGSLEALERPRPGEEDRRRVEAAWAELAAELGLEGSAPSDGEARRVLELAFRARVFLDALDRLTCWRLLHGQDGAEPPGGERPAREP